MTDSSSPPMALQPTVAVGATTVLVGGILMIVGSALNWFDLDGATFGGFTSGLENVTEVKGATFGVFGVVMVGLGIAQLVAKRVLTIGIVGAMGGIVALVVGLKVLSDVGDFLAPFEYFGADVSTGPGLYVVILGAAATLGGSILTLIKKPA